MIRAILIRNYEEKFIILVLTFLCILCGQASYALTDGEGNTDQFDWDSYINDIKELLGEDIVHVYDINNIQEYIDKVNSDDNPDNDINPDELGDTDNTNELDKIQRGLIIPSYDAFNDYIDHLPNGYTWTESDYNLKDAYGTTHAGTLYTFTNGSDTFNYFTPDVTDYKFKEDYFYWIPDRQSGDSTTGGSDGSGNSSGDWSGGFDKPNSSDICTIHPEYCTTGDPNDYDPNTNNESNGNGTYEGSAGGYGGGTTYEEYIIPNPVVDDPNSEYVHVNSYLSLNYSIQNGLVRIKSADGTYKKPSELDPTKFADRKALNNFAAGLAQRLDGLNKNIIIGSLKGTDLSSKNQAWTTNTTISLNTNGGYSTDLDNINNFKSILKHEIFHVDNNNNGIGSTLSNHVDVYINEFAYITFKNTTDDYKPGKIGSLANYILNMDKRTDINYAPSIIKTKINNFNNLHLRYSFVIEPYDYIQQGRGTLKIFIKDANYPYDSPTPFNQYTPITNEK